MARNTPAAVAEWHTAGPSGLVDSGQRVLHLNGNAMPKEIREVWAVIEGTDQDVESTAAALRSQLLSAVSPSAVRSNGHLDLAGLATSCILEATRGRQGQAPAISVVLVARKEPRVAVARTANTDAFVVGADDVVPLAAPVDPHGIAAGSQELPGGEALVILASRGRDAISAAEVQRTVLGSPTTADSAAWLATTVAARTSSPATALVVDRGIASPFSEDPREPFYRRRGSLILALAALVIVAAIAAVVFRAVLGSGGGRAAPVVAVVGLRAETVSPSKADLVWQPVPHARGYDVDIAGRRVSTTNSRLAVTGGLQPGTTYRWRVRALFASGASAISHDAILHVPALYSAMSIAAVRPRGQRFLRPGHALSFCWNTPSLARSYDLSITGPSWKLVRRLAPPDVYQGKKGATCTRIILPAAGSYSWRVGAIEQDHLEGWTSWTDFRVTLKGSASAIVSPGPTGTSG